MSYDSSYAINLSSLKKCRKKYTVIFFYSIISSLILFLYGFINLVSISPDMFILKMTENTDNMLSPNYFALFIDALIVAPLSLYFGLRVSISQHDLSAFFNISLLTGNILLFFLKRDWDFFHRVPISFFVYVIFSFAGIFFSVLGLTTNFKYHWLEEQEGFPHFSEHLAEYEQNKTRENGSTYLAEFKRFGKTSQSFMDDLPVLSPEQLGSLDDSSGQFYGKEK